MGAAAWFNNIRLPSFLAGPRLQVANLLTFYIVVYWTIDFPNPVERVAASVALALVLDLVSSRIHYGGWRVPWGSMIAVMGAWLVLDGHGWLPYLGLPVLTVAARHLIRFRASHLFNANNLAMCVLLLVGIARVGVNDWGAAPQTLGLMVLFGVVATSRVKRLDLALMYLAFSFTTYYAIATSQGWGMATVFMWSLSPVQVMIGFFAVTDPATSPSDSRLKKAIFALLVVLVGVPATLAGRVEAPIFALLVVAPQRHLIDEAVDHFRPALRRLITRSPDPAEAVGGEGP